MRFEAHVGNLSNRQLLMIGFLCWNDRWKGGQREMNPRIGHQIGLELGQIHVQSSIEAKRRSDRGDNLKWDILNLRKVIFKKKKSYNF